MRSLLLVAALLIGAATAMPAFALEDEDKVDCSDTSFAMKNDKMTVECWREDSVASFTEIAGGLVNEIMIAKSKDRTGVLIAVDSRVLHQHIVLKRYSLREESGQLADNSREWTTADSRDGFEIGEYRDREDGYPCLAFRRYVTFKGREVKRLVVGYVCARGDHRNAYALLSELTAAGE